MKQHPILIVEDGDAVFFIISKAFRTVGVTNPIFRCETGDDALAYLFRKGGYADIQKYPCPGIILLDLRLPGTGGREVLRAVKGDDELKIIPVIMMTGSAKEDDITGCYRDGANSYILKPRDSDETVRCIRCFASYWLDTAVLPYGGE